MTEPLSPHFLPNLIQGRIDAHEAAHPTPCGMSEDWMAWHRANNLFAETLLVELASDHGCRFKVGGSDTDRMRLAGISISCTSGPLQLLRGWVRKARATAEARS